MKKNNKEKKERFEDDGRTIYNMDVDGMPHRVKHSGNGVSLTRKEKKAAIIAALLHYMPIVFLVIVCFGLAMLFIYFWLK